MGRCEPWGQVGVLAPCRCVMPGTSFLDSQLRAGMVAPCLALGQLAASPLLPHPLLTGLDLSRGTRWSPVTLTGGGGVQCGCACVWLLSPSATVWPSLVGCCGGNAKGFPHQPLCARVPAGRKVSVALALGLAWTRSPYKLGKGRGEAACPRALLPSVDVCGASWVGPFSVLCHDCRLQGSHFISLFKTPWRAWQVLLVCGQRPGVVPHVAGRGKHQEGAPGCSGP